MPEIARSTMNANQFIYDTDSHFRQLVRGARAGFYFFRFHLTPCPVLCEPKAVSGGHSSGGGGGGGAQTG